MPAVIDKEKPIPLYYQIEAYIQEQIRTGKLSPEERLPTEQWYCSFFGVSRMTVRRALQELISSGVLERRRGQGPAVAPICPAPPRTHYFSLYDSFAERGVRLTTQVLSLENIPAQEQEARRLGVSSGAPLLSLCRIRHAEGSPIAYQHTYLRQSPCGHAIRPSALKSSSLYAVLEKQNVFIHHADQRFSACSADPALAELLGVEVNAPLLYAERTSYLRDGTTLEYSRSWLRPSNLDMTVKLYR